jgi:hypothetical protein
VEPTEQVATSSQPVATTSTSAATDSNPELEKHASFLGYRPGFEVTAEQPETSAATETTEEVETQPETATEAQTEPEDDPNWLPDEQSKVFPDDVIAKYGKRYGYTAEQIQENPSLRQLLHDKINSRHLHRQPADRG